MKRLHWPDRMLKALALAAFFAAAWSMVSAETIDPIPADAQYAWGENVGWLNAEPSGDGGPGITVSGTKLTGYMWGENIGWINMNCTNNGTCGSTGNYGVTNDGAGHLAGYAWGENVGWISFSCANNASCGAADYGVNIDPATGDFSGNAWGENIGWISFADTAPVAYKVTTDDGDAIAGASDNCPFDSNVAQANRDGNFIDLHVFGKLFDDITVVVSDNLGDICDPDIDNDGLLNEVEPEVAPAGNEHGRCESASAPLDPMLSDTDDDMVLDGAECAMGTDPANAASKPPAAPAGDTDHDGLTDAFEATIGTNPALVDTDGDRLLDSVDFKGYMSSPLALDTDGDVCPDGREAASVNADVKVNSLDMVAVASHFGPRTSGKYIKDFDVNKDGNINSIDMLIQAKLFTSLPC